MENGINLSSEKSIVEFETLLSKAFNTVSIMKLKEEKELTESLRRENQAGKYFSIRNSDNQAYIWIGCEWKKNNKNESIFWLEFDKKTCSPMYWNKIYKLINTSGTYYSKVDSEFAQVYMNTWIHFYLKDEYLKHFYGENCRINDQEEIIGGFINEVLEKL